jgi:hypothetical protein
MGKQDPEGRERVQSRHLVDDPLGLPTPGGVEDALAQADPARCDLDELVVLDELERELEGDLAGGLELDVLVVRMFVSRFSLLTFTSMSSVRTFSPTIIPAYTGSPGLTNIVARSWRLKSAKPTATPSRSATSTPRDRPRSCPAHGPHESKVWCRMPSPRVSVRNSLR